MTAQEFIRSFTFRNAKAGTPQQAFNEVKAKYGFNEAFSYALTNWRFFGNYDPDTGLYGAMAAAGVSDVGQKQIINTYSSNSRSRELGPEFRQVSGGFFGMGGYTSYAKQFFKG